MQKWDGQFPENWEPVLLSEHRSVSLQAKGMGIDSPMVEVLAPDVFPPAEGTLDPSTARINAGSSSPASIYGTFEWKDADPRFPPTGNFAR